MNKKYLILTAAVIALTAIVITVLFVLNKEDKSDTDGTNGTDSVDGKDSTDSTKNTERNTDTAPPETETKNYTKWISYTVDSEFWKNTESVTTGEFTDTVFHWTAGEVSAERDGKVTKLYSGMPIWNVFFSDITGDGYPDLCSTVSIGSGWIDERIIVYDYKNMICYSLSDRFNFNFVLAEGDGSLFVKRFDFNGGEPTLGKLTLKDGELSMLPIE